MASLNINLDPSELSDAAATAVIELLINPEYGSEWLLELLDIDADVRTISNEDYAPVENLDGEITTALRKIADALIAGLPADSPVRKNYES